MLVNLDPTSAHKLVPLLAARELKLSCAESCTGGLLAGALTSVPGCSRVFVGGIVAYANQAKIDLLKVSSQLLADNGAVSKEVAIAMAIGAARAFDCSIALSTTGIAGPGGGSKDKAVGTVWWAMYYREQVAAARLVLQGDRDTVRIEAVARILSAVVDELKEA